jgi:hypothetical protein
VPKWTNHEVVPPQKWPSPYHDEDSIRKLILFRREAPANASRSHAEYAFHTGAIPSRSHANVSPILEKSSERGTHCQRQDNWSSFSIPDTYFFKGFSRCIECDEGSVFCE